MNIQYRTKDLTLSDHTREHIERKLTALERLMPPILEILVRCESNQHHNKGDVIFVSVDVKTSAQIFHAEEQGANVEGCVELLLEDLKNQMGKFEGKRDSRLRRDTRLRRMMKSFLFWK